MKLCLVILALAAVTGCSSTPGYRTTFSLEIGGTFAPPAAWFKPTWTSEPVLAAVATAVVAQPATAPAATQGAKP